MPADAPEFSYDVFLSHSAKDKAVVRDVAERLRPDGSPKNTQLSTQLSAGMERSRVLVLCMSANAFGSDWAQWESGTFRFRDPLNKERRFLPLRLAGAARNVTRLAVRELCWWRRVVTPCLWPVWSGRN